MKVKIFALFLLLWSFFLAIWLRSFDPIIGIKNPVVNVLVETIGDDNNKTIGMKLLSENAEVFNMLIKEKAQTIGKEKKGK